MGDLVDRLEAELGMRMGEARALPGGCGWECPVDKALLFHETNQAVARDFEAANPFLRYLRATAALSGEDYIPSARR